MQRAAEGKRGEEALKAIGAAYGELLASDRLYLRAQMQAYAASEDPDVAAVARGGFGDLVAYVERVSGLGMDEISRFFANGMLMNVLASLQARPKRSGAGGCSRAARTDWSCSAVSFFRQEVSDDSQIDNEHLVDIRDHLARALHGHARQPRRDDGDPGDPPGPARRDQRPRVDRQRLHAHLRRAAPHRRGARRPLRTPAAVRDRDRDLHGRLRGRRARADDRRARRGPRRPGPRRRDRHAADAHDPLGRRARGAARRVPRRVGRHQRPRRRVRPARRRRRRQRLLVALGLLAQRAGRDRAARRSCRASPRRRGRSAASTCPGLVLASVGLFGIVWGLVRGNSVGLGLAGDRRRARRRRRRDRAVRGVGAAHRASDAADAVLPQPHLRARERRVAPDELRDVRLDLPARAVLPDGAGLLAARLGPAHPAVDGDADGRRADRRRALRPHPGEPHHRHRARAAGDRPRLDRGRLDADDAVRRPRRFRSRSPASAWGCSSPRSRTSSSASVRGEEEGQASGANNAIRELGGVLRRRGPRLGVLALRRVRRAAARSSTA